MRVLQIGNGGSPHSTENELRKACEANGHAVTFLQENEPGTFLRAGTLADEHDFVLWTKTDWQPPVPRDEMWRMVAMARRADTPVASYHLDLFHSLPRAVQIDDHPFFHTDLVCTADGGHDAEWERCGVEHVWFPPGVSAAECVPAEPDPRFTADIAFVGSWAGYHPEDTGRADLIRWLQHRSCRFWPQRNEAAVRGEDLRRLYATTKVNVGTSCFAGMGAARYWSDRIPETLGRGGFLLHPHVPGIEDHYTDGEHLRLWEAGDYVELQRLVDHYLAHDDERRRIAEEGRRHVIETATYDVRIRQLVDLLAERGMLAADRAA